MIFFFFRYSTLCRAFGGGSPFSSSTPLPTALRVRKLLLVLAVRRNSQEKITDNFRDKLGHGGGKSFGRMAGNGFKDQWSSGMGKVGLREKRIQEDGLPHTGVRLLAPERQRGKLATSGKNSSGMWPFGVCVPAWIE